MFGIGIPEFILILVVGLVVFGPSKLPEIGRAVGKGLREFRKASSAFQSILNAPDDTPARTMAATHGGEKSAAELAASEKKTETQAKEKKTTENAKEDKAEKTEPEKQETKWEPPKDDIVKVAETAHGYTPPTQESVQAAINANK